MSKRRFSELVTKEKTLSQQQDARYLVACNEIIALVSTSGLRPGSIFFPYLNNFCSWHMPHFEKENPCFAVVQECILCPSAEQLLKFGVPLYFARPPFVLVVKLYFNYPACNQELYQVVPAPATDFTGSSIKLPSVRITQLGHFDLPQELKELCDRFLWYCFSAVRKKQHLDKRATDLQKDISSRRACFRGVETPAFCLNPRAFSVNRPLCLKDFEFQELQQVENMMDDLMPKVLRELIFSYTVIPEYKAANALMTALHAL